MKKIHLFAFLILVPLISCVYTEITAFKDPDFAGVSYSNLIVIFRNDNLKIVKMGEEIFARVFQSKGVNMIKGLDVLLPTRNYSAEEELEIFNKNNIDAVLTVDLKSAHSNREYHFSEGHVTHTDTDYLTFNLILKDVRKDKHAWTATTTTQGNDLYFETYLESLALSVHSRLVKDSLLKQN